MRPGGWLVYATCSLEPEENEDQIEALLARDHRFERDPGDAVPADLRTARGDLQLLPFRHGTDGAYAARLRRRRMKFGRRNRQALNEQIEAAPEKQPEPVAAPLFEPPPSTRGTGRKIARDLGLLLLIFVIGFAIAFIWLAPGPLLASDHSTPDVVGMAGRPGRAAARPGGVQDEAGRITAASDL